MIRIKKVSIENFKGIKEKTVFDFEKDGARVNILSGPNGFGKTTLFEAIEVCLTGNIERANLYEKVQGNQGHKKTLYYRNTVNSNVTLRVWLTEGDDNHIITKNYPLTSVKKNDKKSYYYLPSDSTNLFSTYYSRDETIFDTDALGELIYDYSIIDNIVFKSSFNTTVANRYLLFNYIQQEDSKYFLKQAQREKGDSIGFLLDIDKQQDESDRIKETLGTLQDNYELLDKEIEVITKDLPDVKEIEYSRLFENFDFDFDKEKPFKNSKVSKEQLDLFLDRIDTLKSFKERFSVVEYNKYLNFQIINTEIIPNDRVLLSMLFSALYEENLWKKIQEKNEKIWKGKGFVNTINDDFIPKEIFEMFLIDWEDLYSEYIATENQIKAVNKDLGAIGNIISELNINRSKTFAGFVKLLDAEHLTESKCPLCDTSFESLQLLDQAINLKSESLDLYNRQKLEEKEKLLDKLKKYHDTIKHEIDAYLKTNQETDQFVISILREYPSFKDRIEEMTYRFKLIESKQFVELLLKSVPANRDELYDSLKKLRAFFSDSILPFYGYNDSLLPTKHLFKEFFDSNEREFNQISIESIDLKRDYLLSEFKRLSNSRLAFLSEQKDILEKFLQKVSEVHGRIEKTINKYKEEQIKKIRIPFYVYSGKILQSYQQGQGIFIIIDPTEKKNKVQLRTGHQSDHDIVYHLSSGQLDVVAIAFCLSLNKVYNTNDNFKFLAIDDPVKTMDDLNVHTFIELLRNEFSDYQIIMSTHDDFTSRYMKYKFEKIQGMKTEIQNVQNVVLQALN